MVMVFHGKPSGAATDRRRQQCGLRQCGTQVKFRAKERGQQVICNVYVDGRWNRVEHYHSACYADAGEPHGGAG